MNEKGEEWALFWCSLIHEAIFRDEEDPRSINRILKEKTREEIVFPNGSRGRPSLRTLHRKYQAYRTGGFDAVTRKVRSDRGKPRGIDPEVIARAIAIKRDQPTRSPRIINQFLRGIKMPPVARSTLLRHLKAAGATRIRLDAVKKPVRKRWSRNHTHDLWEGDFADGPYVLVDGVPVPTRLSVFIDAHSRFVPAARYYYRQNLDVLVDTLLKAWAAHGASKELYVDNAKVYHAKALKAACLRLGIDLFHRRKGEPEGGGLVEAIIQLIQEQFEAEVRAGDILTLSELNRGLAAWLEIGYHREIHSETKQTPKERYETGLGVIRRVDMDVAIRSFMQSVRRTVHKDFSDIRLYAVFYRVDLRLRGERVIVRYDPFSTIEHVEIYSLHDEYLGTGRRHNREEGERVPSTPQHKPTYNYLDLIIGLHDEELKKGSCGIDYRKVAARQGWSFPSFARAFARLLGRKGGLSGFTTRELEELRKAFNRLPNLSEPMLRKAFEQAEVKTIPVIVKELVELDGKES